MDFDCVINNFIDNHCVVNIREFKCCSQQMVNLVLGRGKELVLALNVDVDCWLPADIVKPVRFPHFDSGLLQ